MRPAPPAARALPGADHACLRRGGPQKPTVIHLAFAGEVPLAAAAASVRADRQAWMSAGAGVPLPAGRPLWQASLVQGMHGGSVPVMRAHHLR